MLTSFGERRHEGEIGKDFSTWIKERIELYNFVENADYIVHKIVIQYNQVDRIDYHIILDMAKELSMVERNEKGKQARQYFIECERELKSISNLPDFNNPVIAARARADEEIVINDLIKIGKAELEGQTIPTVNARDLHAFLESKQEFAAWIKNRIRDYNFNENVDFVCLTNLSSEGRGGQNKIDYHISFDMAKEISMVERNEKGKQARQYFMACERKR